MPEITSVRELLSLREKLHGKKDQFSQHWEDLSRIHLPRRGGFIDAFVPGESRMDDLFDGTGMQSARSLANHLAFWLRPDGEDWMRVRAEDDRLNNIEEARLWLEDSEDRMFRAMRNPKARFRQATGETDLDLVVFGTGVLFTGEGSTLDHLLYMSNHLKDVAIYFDEEGRPQGIFRDWCWTVRNLVNRFGIGKVHENVRQMHNQNRLDEKVNLTHVVMQRKGGDPFAILARNLPYMDMWIDRDNKHKLKEGGFHEFPFVVPRWDTTAGEDYGRSPAMIALPDGNTLQAMEETALVSGQRQADPPLMAPNDGMFNALNTFPGGVSYYNPETAATVGGNPVFPLVSGANLPLTREMQVDKRDQVMSAFFRNILNLPTHGPQMTATEVIQRKEEFIRELGPVFGRFETDYTAPMVERTFNIMLRAAAFGPIPEVLQGQNVRFEFESPVNKTREQVKSLMAKTWALDLIEMSQADPTVRHIANWHEMARFAAEASSVPFALINSPEAVAQLVEQELKAQAEAEQQAKLAGMAEAGEKGAKAIKALRDSNTANQGVAA